jgi:hypothetical protein
MHGCKAASARNNRCCVLRTCSVASFAAAEHTSSLCGATGLGTATAAVWWCTGAAVNGLTERMCGIRYEADVFAGRMLQLHVLAESAVCIVPSLAKYGYYMIKRAIPTHNDRCTQVRRDRHANEPARCCVGNWRGT